MICIPTLEFGLRTYYYKMNFVSDYVVLQLHIILEHSVHVAYNAMETGGFIKRRSSTREFGTYILLLALKLQGECNI